MYVSRLHLVLYCGGGPVYVASASLVSDDNHAGSADGDTSHLVADALRKAECKAAKKARKATRPGRAGGTGRSHRRTETVRPVRQVGRSAGPVSVQGEQGGVEDGVRQVLERDERWRRRWRRRPSRVSLRGAVEESPEGTEAGALVGACLPSYSKWYASGKGLEKYGSGIPIARSVQRRQGSLHGHHRGRKLATSISKRWCRLIHVLRSIVRLARHYIQEKNIFRYHYDYKNRSQLLLSFRARSI